MDELATLRNRLDLTMRALEHVLVVDGVILPGHAPDGPNLLLAAEGYCRDLKIAPVGNLENPLTKDWHGQYNVTLAAEVVEAVKSHMKCLKDMGCTIGDDFSARMIGKYCMDVAPVIMKSYRVNLNNGYIPKVGERVRVMGHCHPRCLGKVVEVSDVKENYYESWHYDAVHGKVFSGGELGSLEAVPPETEVDTF